MAEPNQRPETDGGFLEVTPSYLPASYAQTAEDPEGLQLDYLKLFRRYSLLALLLVIVGACGGFLSVAVMTPEYRAGALLEVQSATGGMLKVQGIPEDPGSQIDLTTEAEILQSRTFLRQVAQRLQLENPSPAPVQSDVFSRIRRIIRGKQFDEESVSIGDAVGPDGGKLPKSLAIAMLSLKVEPVDRTHLIQITCESPNPQVAADFLNGLIDEYTQHNYQARMDAVRSTSQWISTQVAEAKTRTTEADARLQDFMRTSGSAFVGKDDTLGQAKLEDVQERLAAANSDLIAKQTLYETLHKTPADALVNVIDDPVVRQYQARIADLRREEATLTTTLTPEHPKVKAIEAQIANLLSSQQKELSTAIKRIDSQYETAKRTRELLRNNYATVAQQVADLSGKEAQYNALKKESESARDSYQALVLQANQASIVGSLPMNNIQTIDRPVPAEKPYKPKPLMNIAGGAAAGLALCCGIGFLREKMDKLVTSPSQVRKLFNLPQLGIIPSAGEQKARWRLLPDLGRNRFPESNITTLGSGASAANAISSMSRMPLVAESFRATLASLMRDSAGMRRPQVILVTSPGPEEGKTTIASNLGIALAETGRSVLIVDADFRRPRLHKLFGIANDRGLVDLLGEELPVGSYPRDVLALKTFVPLLRVLPNGKQSQNITSILYAPRFRELMRRLRVDFDTVLIDAPPMLPVADARVVSEMADGVVLVIRVGVTDKESAVEALEQLRSDRTVVLGTILNDWKASRAQAKRRYYYSALDSTDEA